MVDTAIVGAGPYGLSVAAHLKHQGIPFRIFGRLMDSWAAHMPKGMLLKSDGFASNIYDPESEFTLERFCANRKIEYADSGLPVRLDTFTAYGRAFAERLIPELENRLITSIEHSEDGFVLRTEDGETFSARRVVLAIGITHFQYVPDNLAHLPPELLSHSFNHHELDSFKGRSVIVIGGGSSATDMAGLLREAGIDVQLVSRRATLIFHTKPTGKPRPLWKRIRHPKSGLGPGMRSRFFSDFPAAFHYLPKGLRVEVVRRTLGPSGGWFARDMVMGKLPLHLGCTLQEARVEKGRVRLALLSADGTKREIVADHLIAATGYKVNLERLEFLSPEIRGNVKTLEHTPVLSSTFESSVPGLYFVGIAAANGFGPVMRFAFGAGFAARTVAAAVKRSAARQPALMAVRAVATSAK